MGGSIALRFGALYALSTCSSCVGRSGNTKGSVVIRSRRGIGYDGFKPGSQPCLPTGSRMLRLDDRSRMNREVHVRFWEGVGLQLLCATRLSARVRQCHRGENGPDPILQLLQYSPRASSPRLPSAGRGILRRARGLSHGIESETRRVSADCVGRLRCWCTIEED
jgi:hypothetical protein